ncbi:response regulator transcription factor [Pseudobutyrivibrio xylanivorans]|uniref:Stage 0 sporulation protein A homolog n=1 Tax=Pseudobutyrivibrio xylanivorans DSM 14809 TaxID=1123012 RepID=A0A1M6FWZ4_PSEXY|nr:response regulator transcription factor [Pseudobutyrivibrio xylanivorans]SHJ02184.1 DNA-binding response regulator, OmpR family, contains REC and winged-helix (wHTH) domain [Pseudobutyrivibrio xylanivorans DSM 14809]
MKNVLIVEDDEIIAGEVAKHLSLWQMKCTVVEDFGKVIETFNECAPDIVLMDLHLPCYNGFYWCGEIRKISQVPVVFLSSADDNMNIVMAMNMGADDFIAKPFDLQVLTAKLQAILRRSYGESISVHKLEVGNISLNLDDTTATIDGDKLDLTKNEYLILKALMERPGKVVSRESIMERLWGADEFVDDNTLTVNVTRIRKKIEAAGVPDFITTKRGLGYIVGE